MLVPSPQAFPHPPILEEPLHPCPQMALLHLLSSIRYAALSVSWLQVLLFIDSLVSCAIANLVTDKAKTVAVADAILKVGTCIASASVVLVYNIQYGIVS